MENQTLWDSQSKGLFVDPPLSECLQNKKCHCWNIKTIHLDVPLNGEGLGNATSERDQWGLCPTLLLKMTIRDILLVCK